LSRLLFDQWHHLWLIRIERAVLLLALSLMTIESHRLLVELILPVDACLHAEELPQEVHWFDRYCNLVEDIVQFTLECNYWWLHLRSFNNKVVFSATSLLQFCLHSLPECSALLRHFFSAFIDSTIHSELRSFVNLLHRLQILIQQLSKWDTFRSRELISPDFLPHSNIALLEHPNVLLHSGEERSVFQPLEKVVLIFRILLNFFNYILPYSLIIFLFPF